MSSSNISISKALKECTKISRALQQRRIGVQSAHIPGQGHDEKKRADSFRFHYKGFLSDMKVSLRFPGSSYYLVAVLFTFAANSSGPFRC